MVCIRNLSKSLLTIPHLLTLQRHVGSSVFEDWTGFGQSFWDCRNSNAALVPPWNGSWAQPTSSWVLRSWSQIAFMGSLATLAALVSMDLPCAGPRLFFASWRRTCTWRQETKPEIKVAQDFLYPAWSQGMIVADLPAVSQREASSLVSSLTFHSTRWSHERRTLCCRRFTSLSTRAWDAGLKLSQGGSTCKPIGQRTNVKVHSIQISLSVLECLTEPVTVLSHHAWRS